MNAGLYLACEVHGRLVRRAQPEEAWVCAGFDGEGEGWCTAGPVPAAARERLLAGETYWPGVVVLTPEGEAAGLQRELSPAAAQVREAVNRILRAGPR